MPNITLNQQVTTTPLTLSFGGGEATYSFSTADTGDGPGLAVATEGDGEVSSFFGDVSDFSASSTIDSTDELYGFSAFPTATLIPYSAADDYIGLSFTLSDGVHYGYVDVDGATVVSEGYNTTAGASTTTGAVDLGSQPGLVHYTDVTTGQSGEEQAQTYSGPVAGLEAQYLWSGSDPVAIRSDTPNAFLHGGPGDDAVEATSGSNVLDGGAGSNFLVGATGADGGTDTFYVDGRGGATTWSSIVNFHEGDTMTLWGFVAGTSTLPAYVTDGVAGYQGATIHSELSGAGTGVNEFVTFAGLSPSQAGADFTTATGSVGGTPYLSICTQAKIPLLFARLCCTEAARN